MGAVARNWTRNSIAPADWTVSLPDAAVGELLAVRDEMRRAPVPTFVLDPNDFALDTCRATMDEVRRRTQDGPMFAVLDRLPLPELTREEAIGVYWLMSSLLARPVAQKLNGQMFFDVMDTGAKLKPGSGIRRGASSSAESGVFHQYTFFTVFQPIADLGTGEAVGYEALTRFADGQSPQESLASAREAGIGVELDLALAHAAVTSARALPPGTWLSINVSPGLAQQADKLSEILADSPCPLVIEIGDSPEAEDLVEGPLRRIPGVTVAIDDAGAGYESLARITRLRPSYMKLHRDAIVGIDHDAARQMFVTTLVSFARQHDCRVIAEGVETEAERDALCAAGVELGQGYFVGRPVPVDRMEHAPARS